MDEVLSLARITEHDEMLVGKTALGLSQAMRERHPIPLSFVIPASYFDAFLEQTGMQEVIEDTFEQHSNNDQGRQAAYEELAVHFKKIHFSEQLQETLIEAYETLAINIEESGATRLVQRTTTPRVSMQISLTYDEENPFLCLQHNIVTPQSFLDAIKKSWLAAYHPYRVHERMRKRISNFGVGVIVSQQPRAIATIDAAYRQAQQQPIALNSYYGMPQDEGFVKDRHDYAGEPLQLVRSAITTQRIRYVPSETSGIFDHSPLQDQGGEQAVPNEALLEAARTIKKLHAQFARDLNARFMLSKKQLLLTNLQLLGPSIVMTDEQAKSAEPRIIVEEEKPSVDSVQDRPIPPTEDLLVIIEDEESPEEERQAGPVEVYDAAPKGESEEGPAEETLFDLFKGSREEPAAEDEEDPVAGFVLEAYEQVKDSLQETCQESIGESVDDYAALLSKLATEGLLEAPEGDYRRLLAAVLNIENGGLPKDEEVGLAWRLLKKHS